MEKKWVRSTEGSRDFGKRCNGGGSFKNEKAMVGFWRWKTRDMLEVKIADLTMPAKSAFLY